MKKMALIILVSLNLTGCLRQRAWLLDAIADGLDKPTTEEQSE